MKFATEWPIYAHPAHPGSGQMKRSHRLANGLRPGQPRDGRSTRLQYDFSPGGPEPTSRNLRGKSCSARAKTDRGSKVVKPSNAIAFIGGSELPTVGTIPPNKQVATLPVAKFTNCLRLSSISIVPSFLWVY